MKNLGCLVEPQPLANLPAECGIKMIHFSFNFFCLVWGFLFCLFYLFFFSLLGMEYLHFIGQHPGSGML